MLKLNQFDLFLFDFDGLLVNTEELHQRAYEKALKKRGCTLPWDFTTYITNAHKSPVHLKNEMIKQCPQLEQEHYENFYEDKKKLYQELLLSDHLSLMDGVDRMLKLVKDKPHAVVTNSNRLQTEMIKKALPILESIPLWITREDYTEPKPAPDSYRKALEKLPRGRAIGFEDSLKGINALKSADITAVCIKPPLYPSVDGASYLFESFTELLDHQRM